MLKNQISQGFDGREFFKRNLYSNDLSAADLLNDMMPDIDHAKTIKQIKEEALLSGNTSLFKNV